jgi:hypothetical protein
LTLTIILAVGYPVAFLGAVIMLMDYLRARDQAEREERAKLLVHIQSPVQALAERAEEDVEDLPAVTFEDDADFWESKGVDVREAR